MVMSFSRLSSPAIFFKEHRELNFNLEDKSIIVEIQAKLGEIFRGMNSMFLNS